MMKMMNYKPGWWAAYFIYCTIPISIYICFLISQARKSGFWQGIVDFTAENPWIWTVYIILLGLPVMLIIYCCCFTTQEVKESNKNQFEADTDDLLENNKENADDDEESEETKEPTVEETAEQSSGKEELDNPKNIAPNKETSSSVEGPRRRKPNKE